MQNREWKDAGEGWQGAEAKLRLQGWSKARRVVILRRSVKKEVVVADQSDPAQLRLGFAELSDDITLYEYGVLITSLQEALLNKYRFCPSRPQTG